MHYPTIAPGFRFYYEWVYLNSLGQELIHVGDLPVTPVGSGEFARDLALGTTTTATLWDAATDPMTAFTCIMLYATGTVVEVELTAGQGLANEELMLLQLVPGRPPLILPSNYTKRAHAANDAFAGTATVIDLIRARNISATTAATVTMRAFR